jgi:hypothetical protein
MSLKGRLRAGNYRAVPALMAEMAAGGRHQPSLGPVGNAAARPGFECRSQCLRESILAGGNVARAGRHDGQQPAVGKAHRAAERAVRVAGRWAHSTGGGRTGLTSTVP